MDNSEKDKLSQEDGKDENIPIVCAETSGTPETLKPETPEESAIQDASEEGAIQGVPEESALQDAPDAQAQIAELTDRLQRTMADFDNFRKRTQKERVGMRDEGVSQTIEKLLPVLDNFERAMDASNSKDPFVVGMQMIFKQLTGTLKDEIGICEIPALNEEFNPEVHFAVSHVDDKQFKDNEVIEVLEKGYKYKDKVIRPSMVRVAN